VEAADGDQEGLGLVTIEAIACGGPVLVGDVAAIKDLPIATVDTKNTDVFASRLAALLRDGFGSAVNIREKMHSVFSWNCVARNYTSRMENI